ALQSYVVMVGIRMVAMSLVPLEPPPTMISLTDPTVEYLGTGTLLTKDLFFSGHTSTLFLLFLSAQIRWQKGMFLVCFVVVAVCVLIQHVHYTIDVFAAPFFAYGAYRLVVLGRRPLTRWFYGASS
ncbi:MAG: phosphatase PAP2-related protein, partial [Bacteroidota bacterium]